MFNTQDEHGSSEKSDIKIEDMEVFDAAIKEEKTGYDADGEEEFPDDSFHMVTQYNWEEDIIWNGDDIKHKVQNISSWTLF